jgi:hypothetical protein
MMLMWNRLGFEQCENYSNGRYAYSSQVQTGDSNKATAQQYSGSSSITQIKMEIIMSLCRPKWAVLWNVWYRDQ